MSAERRTDAPADAAEGVGGGGAPGQEAQIISRGYRPYDGPRTSLRGSVLSIVLHSTRYTLGMGRAFRYKLLPWFAIMVAVLPAVVFVALAASPSHDLKGTDALLGYHLYYTLPVSVALVFFCGLSVPDILVPDRRNGMLSLYMSTRMGLWSYLASKALAAALMSAIITVLPVLILVLSHVIEGEGPAGPGDWAILMARIAAAGFVSAAAIVALSMAISSLTDRRGFASTGVFLLTAGGAIIATLLATGGMGARGYGLGVLSMTFEAVDRIYAAGPELVPMSGTVSVDSSIGVQTPPVGSPGGDAQLNAQASGNVAWLETWFVALCYAAWAALGVLGVCLCYWRRGADV